MLELPLGLSLAFGAITIATVFLFRRIMMTANAARTRQLSTPVLVGFTGWLAIQAVVSQAGVYSTTPDAMPPRIFLFGVLPTFVVIAATFLTASGRRFIDSLSPFHLTMLHTIRIFVELVLWWLFLEGAIPKLMTFEGRNLDIIAGLTAPIVAYLGIRKNMLPRSTVLIWNLISLGLLVNIVTIAVLSVPSPIQQLAFDQPNKAVLYFPFSWLPSFVVPAVLFCHLSAIRHFLKHKTL